MSGINIYCDESTHLANDRKPYLVLGAIKCQKVYARRLSEEIRAIKADHGHKPYIEAKWTNVSPANVELYLALINYFFDTPELSARIVVAPKSNLDHTRFKQTFDDWYFKIYYLLLLHVIGRRSANYIYIDIKDDRSAAKVSKLHNYLANALYDFEKDTVKGIQVIRSHESELMQLVDTIIGAVNFACRKDLASELLTSEAKLAVIAKLRERSRHNLISSTPKSASKLNQLIWRSQ